MPHSQSSHYRGCLLGLACGDAVGVAAEFKPRGTFEPVTDMIGGGAFRLRPGEWTDDTSMALCLAESLIERKRFDARDQMERYVRWWKKGHLSSNGRCFDIGDTTRAALTRFLETRDPFSGSTHPRTAGNGSLMRLAPVAMYFAPDHAAAVHHAGESSKTTHGAAEAVDACRCYAALLTTALAGGSKAEILATPAPDALAPKIAEIATGAYRDKAEPEIESTGYVVHALEAALWCFERTESYEDAVLEATNLGYDADTTAAICGQVAGAHYGVEGIPEAWRERVAMREEIEAMADGLCGARG
jgi:ADP-ribosyl-[dinitrogen reductase] hydrolase